MDYEKALVILGLAVGTGLWAAAITIDASTARARAGKQRSRRLWRLPAGWTERRVIVFLLCVIVFDPIVTGPIHWLGDRLLFLQNTAGRFALIVADIEILYNLAAWLSRSWATDRCSNW